MGGNEQHEMKTMRSCCVDVRSFSVFSFFLFIYILDVLPWARGCVKDPLEQHVPTRCVVGEGRC